MTSYPYDISMVLPVYNEQDNIKAVHEELDGVLQKMRLRYQIIYVDDGSRDESPARLREISEASAPVKVVLLRRNFGQTAAIQAGIDQATGGIICLMDSESNSIPAMRLNTAARQSAQRLHSPPSFHRRPVV